SLVNIMATTFMSGISGSSVADASAIGSVMIPQMEKSGYPRVFSTNVTISASVQGLLVPPSHNAVIYSLATGGTISIASLFMAGVMPGLLLGASLMLLCVVLAYRYGHPTGEAVPLKDALKITFDAMWGMIMLMNLGIGLCHPPVGATLFVGCAVGRVRMEDVMREIWPFYGVMFLVLMAVTYIPAISLWLPRALSL